MTEITAFPISGGGFITQLGQLCNILEAKPDYRPDIMMGSSGGCVAAYIAMAANFRSDYIVNIIKQLNHKDYIGSEWTPELIRPLFRNYMYKDRDDGLINRIMIGGIIDEVEIWMGAFNSNESKAALFCNRSHDRCHLHFDQEYMATAPAIHLDGNTPEIIDALRASVNIPCLKPQVRIRGKNYSDGGGRYASPLSCLKHEIARMPSFHLIYISSENLYRSDYNEHHGFIKTAIHGIGELIRSIKIQDLQAAKDLINNAQSIEITHLSEYFRLREQYLKTVLEVYPEVPNSVNITNFNSAAGIQCLKYSSVNMKLVMWY